MNSNCITHNHMFTLSKVIGLNINSTLYTTNFKRRQQNKHQVIKASFLLLQITSANINPVTSVCNSFNFSRSLSTISTMLHDLCTQTVLAASSRVILQKMTVHSWSRNSSQVMEPENSLPHLQKHATSHYTEHIYMTVAKTGGGGGLSVFTIVRTKPDIIINCM